MISPLNVGRQLSDVFNPRFMTLVGPSGQMSIGMTGSWSLGPGIIPGTAAVSGAWPSANLAIFIPFRVGFPVVAEQMVVGCGGGAGNNFDVGIYNESGDRLVNSGATARANTAPVLVNITDTLLQPGLYYIALASDSTNTFMRLAPAQAAFCKMFGMRQMATAYTLPTTATFATAANAFVPSLQILVRAATNGAGLKPAYLPPLNVITPFHNEALATELNNTANNINTTASGTIGGAKVVQYMPFSVHTYATAVKMSAMVGATNTGNIDVGIYDMYGRRLINSGSTALGTANTVQEFDITDTTLAPGAYFMAASLENGAGTLFRCAPSVDRSSPSYPLYTETPALFGLPATATMTHPTAGTPPTPCVMGVHFSTLV